MSVERAVIILPMLLLAIFNLIISIPFLPLQEEIAYWPFIGKLFLLVPLQFASAYAFGAAAGYTAHYGELDTHRGVFISCVLISFAYAWISVVNVIVLFLSHYPCTIWDLGILFPAIPALILGVYSFKYHASEVWFWRGQEHLPKRLTTILVRSFAAVFVVAVLSVLFCWFI